MLIHLDLHRPRLQGDWYCDTMFSKVKSKLGNICANIFTNGKFTKVVPMSGWSDSGKSLVDFSDDVGIPEVLTTDGTGEFTAKSTEFIREARRMRTKPYTTEQGRKNQNHAAERDIGFLARRWRLRMTKKRVPQRLWDCGLVYEAEIVSRMARGSDKRTGYEQVTGQTPEIGEWLDFEFYDLVWTRCGSVAQWSLLSRRSSSDEEKYTATAKDPVLARRREIFSGGSSDFQKLKFIILSLVLTHNINQYPPKSCPSVRVDRGAERMAVFCLCGLFALLLFSLHRPAAVHFPDDQRNR